MIVNGNGQQYYQGGWAHDPAFGGSGPVAMGALSSGQVYLTLVSNGSDPWVEAGWNNPAGLFRGITSPVTLACGGVAYGPGPQPNAVVQTAASPVSNYEGAINVPHDGTYAKQPFSLNAQYGNLVLTNLIPDFQPINVFLGVDLSGTTTLSQLIADLGNDGVAASVNDPAVTGVTGYQLELAYPSTGINSTQNFWFNVSDYGDVSVYQVAAEQVVPEPSTLVLAAAGGLCLLVNAWRRRKARRSIPGIA